MPQCPLCHGDGSVTDTVSDYAHSLNMVPDNNGGLAGFVRTFIAWSAVNHNVDFQRLQNPQCKLTEVVAARREIIKCLRDNFKLTDNQIEPFFGYAKGYGHECRGAFKF